MRAVLFKAAAELLTVENIADPEPGEGEVVIRVSRCGVCGTDLHATSGHGMSLPANSQLGHEYAGEVVALGKGVDQLKIGDRVAALPVVGCGQCAACETGIDVLCANFTGYGGGLAEYARVSQRGATVLPADVSAEDGALIEPLAVGRRAVRLVNPAKDARILIIGPGPIGLSVLFWLRERGIENIVMLSSSARRQTLADSMGAKAFITEGDAVDEEVQATLGGKPDIVFEAAGVAGVFARAISLVRPQGIVVGLGFCMQPDPIVPAAALMKDLTIRWSVTYTRQDYQDCADALSRHAGLARTMVTDTVSLDETPEAFELFRRGQSGGGKLLINPWG